MLIEGGAVAVGGASPPTRQRCHSRRSGLGQCLPVEPVVRWPVCGDGPTHREGRPRSPPNHIDELLVRPPPEATPASAGRRHVFVVEIPPRVLQQQTQHDVQQSHRRVSRRCRRYRLLRQAIARFDTEPFAVVVSGLAWCVDERRVSGVAVTRHAVVVVPSIQVRTVDVDGKLDGHSCDRRVSLSGRVE